MANAPSVSDKPATAKPAAKAVGLPRQPLVEERFWKRYSRHGELPLSGAGSFTLHALAVGFLILAGVLAAYFHPSNKSLPVEAVRLDLGGGGGSRAGTPGGEGPGHGPEAVANGSENPQAGNKEEAPPRPDLTPAEKQQLTMKFDPDTARSIAKGPDAMKAFARLDDNVRRKLSDGLRPRDQGQGGSGKGGGRGSGTGTGEGSGRGAGKANLSQREKRMLRWTMSFNTRTGQDYVRQLRGLGAILAIPTKEGPNPEYKVIRDLSKRPAKLLDEDLSQIKRIYWIDDKPRSVQEVMSVLGVRLTPSHFVAFMPLELEEKLFKLEHAYKGLKEDDIHETRFRIVERGGRFEPEVMDQTPKR